MSAARLSTPRLRQLAADLTDRYTLPLVHLSRARILTGAQLDRLLDEPDTSAETMGRVRRRIMVRLHDLGLIDILHRRVGGARAGSAGYVHVLTAAGHKLAALLAGEQAPGRIRHSKRPGPMFIAHALDIAEVYVQLIEHSRTRDFGVAAFVTEPASWWQETGIILRPDAYTVLAAPTHRDCWWLEIDRDTESPARLHDKLRAYFDHADSAGTGPHGVLPTVLFTVPDEHRATIIRSVIAATNPPAELSESITVTTHQQAAALLLRELHKT